VVLPLQCDWLMSVAIRLQAATTAQSAPPDSWLDALTKLVPGELIAAFTAALQIGGAADNCTAQLVTLLVLAPFAALIPWWSVRKTPQKVPVLQYAIRVLAFLLYGLATAPALMAALGDLRWIPGVGSFVVALLASFVIAKRV
jgi:hypothetical protein